VVAAYDFSTRWLSGMADTLPLLLTGVRPAKPSINTMGDRTAMPAYYNRYSAPLRPTQNHTETAGSPQASQPQSAP
jgi:hypothetical protein